MMPIKIAYDTFDTSNLAAYAVVMLERQIHLFRDFG
jgi:hypothetical protein